MWNQSPNFGTSIPTPVFFHGWWLGLPIFQDTSTIEKPPFNTFEARVQLAALLLRPATAATRHSAASAAGNPWMIKPSERNTAKTRGKTHTLMWETSEKTHSKSIGHVRTKTWDTWGKIHDFKEHMGISRYFKQLMCYLRWEWIGIEVI